MKRMCSFLRRIWSERSSLVLYTEENRSKKNHEKLEASESVEGSTRVA